MAVKPVIPQILKTQEAEHGLRQVFGSLRFWDALIVTLLVVTLGWLTDSTYNFLLSWALAKLPVAAPLRQVAAWVLLILPFFLLFFFARWKLQAKEAAPLLQQVDNPQVEGLILFLSRPRENEVENFRQVNATLRDGGGRDGISGVAGPWKLPLVTIERCTTAKALLVIDSAGKEGSRVVRDEFLQLLGRLLPNRKFEILKPEDLAHLRQLGKARPGQLFLFSDLLGKEWPQDVPDPYYGGPEGFETVLDMLTAGLPALTQRALAAKAAAT